MRLLLPIVAFVMLISWASAPGRFEPVQWMPGASAEVIERAFAAGAMMLEPAPVAPPVPQPVCSE